MADPERRVEHGRSERLRADAAAVRERVFVEEQGVPPDLEWDDHDADALHVVAYDGDRPVGAARLRRYGARPRTGKVERVAVLAAERGRGWGRRLMEAIHRIARERGFERLRLHAQTRVVGFYDALGYERTGEGGFVEAGIPHVAMVRSVDPDGSTA